MMQADWTSPSTTDRARWRRAARTSRTRRGSSGARLRRGAGSAAGSAERAMVGSAVAVVIGISLSALLEGFPVALLRLLEQLGARGGGVLVAHPVAEHPIGPDRVPDHQRQEEAQRDQHH